MPNALCLGMIVTRVIGNVNQGNVNVKRIFALIIIRSLIRQLTVGTNLILTELIIFHMLPYSNLFIG
jgi:hypothetical protein